MVIKFPFVLLAVTPMMPRSTYSVFNAVHFSKSPVMLVFLHSSMSNTYTPALNEQVSGFKPIALRRSLLKFKKLP